MAKKKQESPFTGLWHIVSMTTWDEDYFNEEVQAFIEFEADRLFHLGGKTHFHLLDDPLVYEQVRTWWYMAQINAERLGMSDHSWVHVQIVLNIALRLQRLLVKALADKQELAFSGGVTVMKIIGG